jgi:hypothetical protein
VVAGGPHDAESLAQDGDGFAGLVHLPPGRAEIVQGSRLATEILDVLEDGRSFGVGVDAFVVLLHLSSDDPERIQCHSPGAAVAGLGKGVSSGL